MGFPVKNKWSICLLLCLSVIALQCYGSESVSVEVLGEELSIDRYPADGEQLVLFIATGYGQQERIKAMAAGIAELGIEFWGIDLANSLFLPRATSTFRNMDGSYVAGLIEQAHAITGKRVTVMSRAYASIPALRGIHKWQQHQQAVTGKRQQASMKGNYLNGVILLSPELYIEIPELGLEPVFAPITAATNVPVMFFQSGNRGNRWQMAKAVAELEKGGAQVYTKLFPGVTGVFYRADHAPQTTAMLKNLPLEVRRAIKLLQQTPAPQAPRPFTIKTASEGGLDTVLKHFKGDPRPPPLDLNSVDGSRIAHSNYLGKVTVVNFWATWCPPCVEEIPSLNRLRKRMEGKAFELISVDYAEDPTAVQAFMREVDVHFPVLLDTDGKVSALWKVVVFPSTFVIGPDGKIVYGVKGGIHWDTPQVLEQINDLLKPVQDR